ncbi:MAG: hypothetical protein KatS3mg008_1425 [Acidimicrobiales bacterium]|nr:MAG: hypothetical protein KatS3mg008_1425 [Acidimicrobiales bacterium]
MDAPDEREGWDSGGTVDILVPGTSAAVAPGRILGGRYRLVRLVATGGMAQVWEGTDEVLRRRVAVKVLLPHLAADESFVRRFRAEAIAAAGVRHPNIVSIYDTCSDDGVEAIVMEFVEGRNLRQILDAAGPLDPSSVVHIAAEVADALATAHASGMVHRDIKPANIILCDDQRVVVTDFGIAKVRSSDADLTRTGMMLGSVKYLSPEQVEGRTVDGRTDIYALGIVMYECLTGRPPFVGETDAATALARLSAEPPSVRSLRPEVSPMLEAVVLRAMARDPDRRFQTARDLRAALRALEDDGAGSPARASDADPTTLIAPVTTTPRAAATASTPAAHRIPASRPPTARRRRRRGWWLIPMLLTILVCLSLALAIALLERTPSGRDLVDRLLGRSTTPGALRPEPTRPGRPLSVQPSTFDPEGTLGENDQLVDLLVDGDPDTRWRTESYSRRGMNKSGVGVAFTLPATQTISAIEIRTPSRDWTFQLFVSPQPASALADLPAWGEPLAAVGPVAGDLRVELSREARSVLLWITRLGSSPDPSGRYRVEIGEVTLY